jgi:ArsR family transcriptional regulator, arsenate/arsenite/antimonite-responsive transcriptional repressor
LTAVATAVEGKKQASLLPERKCCADALTAFRYFDIYGTMKKARTIAALNALAHESRLDVFRMLVQSGPAGLPAGEIGARLGVPSPTLSFHLSHLKHAGLVTSRRDSRSIIYSADYKAMNDLISYLMENCCRGDAEQCVPAECKPSRDTNVKQPLRTAEKGKVSA